MSLHHLNGEDRAIVRRALEGSLRFLFEPYGEVEYSLRMGLDAAEVRPMVARLAETGDLANDHLGRRAVNNSFNELLNGIGIGEAELMPDADVAYRILALNTEKAHNLREKALEVIRMARDLASLGDAAERDHALVFEDPVLLTLGICYERNGRFAGGTYQPALKRLESFLAQKLSKALETREARATLLGELDEAVTAAVASLKSRGFESPYLKSFVVARINPLRFRPDADEEFEPVIRKMIASAKKFDAGKVKADQIARSGGPPEAAE